MHPKEFERQIDEFQAYVSSLKSLPGRANHQSHIEFEEVFNALSNAIEELKVAGEDLIQQKEQVAVAHQQAERESQRFRNLFEFAPDGYVVTDIRGIILEINQAAMQFLHYPVDYLIGKPLTSYIEQQYIREFFDHLRRFDRVPWVRDWEIQLVSLRGTRIDVSVNAMAEYDETDQPVRLYWLMRDVRERKKILSKVYEVETRYQTVFSAINDGILVFNLSGQIKDGNPAIQNMLGYSLEEIRDILFTDLIRPASRHLIQETIKKIAAGVVSHHVSEVRIIRKDHKDIWVRMSLSLIRDQSYTPGYIVGIIENITSQRQMEDELVEVERRMIDVGEAERLHLARELHDGPLQDLYGIMYQVKIASDTLGVSQTIDDFDRIRDMLQRVIDLLRSITGDLRPPTLAFFGINRAIQSHVENLREIYPDLDIQLDLDEDQQVLSERVRFAYYRIYQHCMANIIRHAGAVAVVVRFKLTPEKVLLEIQDDGSGFTVPDQWIEFVRQGHYGLIGAAERALTVGADFRIRSKPNAGTLIRVTGPRSEDSQTQKMRFSLLISDQSPVLDE